MDPLLLLSATEIARRIRARALGVHDVVEAHIRRIERVEPRVHAVVQDRFAAARTEARRADETLTKATDAEREALPPLFGVPCTIKEAFALEGMPNTGGLVARRGQLATKDATAVQRLRAAGAIPLGVTNISELCMWIESNNYVYGRTNNAYDPGRTCGGSSGGEGAIIGAGGSPFGLGSDVGGSIRLPAYFNGVFGHKPTGGLVPASGQFPCAENDALRYLTSGPLCRRAEDLMPLLRILAGPDGLDARCEAMSLGDPSSVGLAGRRVVVVRRNGIVDIEPEVEASLERAATALEKKGARVTEARLDKLSLSIAMWSSLLHAAGGMTFSEHLGSGKAVNPRRELLRWALRRGTHTLPAIVLALIENVPHAFPAHSEKLVGQALELRHDVESLIEPGGVLLIPTFPRIAPKHNHALFTTLDFGYTAVFNAIETPVTQVPLGLGTAGMPLGIQVVGMHGEDHIPIAVARVLEDVFGGWVPPAQFS